MIIADGLGYESTGGVRSPYPALVGVTHECSGEEYRGIHEAQASVSSE